MENFHDKTIKSMWGEPDINWIHSPSVGPSGGLITLWDSKYFRLSSSQVSRHWISVCGTIISHKFQCAIINLYNPCSVESRALVWQELVEFSANNPLPCLISGDFNEILNPHERGSQSFSPQGSLDFHDFIQKVGLIELKASNGLFTWFRGRSKSKLDRIFVQSEWLSIFPSLKLSLLKRGLSDHRPLLLQPEDCNWGAKPFRFLNCWLSHPQCLKIIQSAWLKGSNLSIPEKLRVTKEDLKIWNATEFGLIDFKIKGLEEKIGHFDKIANNHLLSVDELQVQYQAQQELWAWHRRRESYWAQLSRAKWIKEGDKNTKFFHTLASIRRRKNQLVKIVANGSHIDKPREIKKEAVRYFHGIFKEDHVVRPTFTSLNFTKLSEDECSLLISPFSREEIDEAIKSCDGQKSPGPDGFNFSFIKAAWEVIKEDIYSMVDFFWASRRLPKGCNNAFIALIPKVEGPSHFKEFRPISMVGCLYKIVAKLLARRLQRVMDRLVSHCQTSFIKGRQILDGALIAGEFIDSCKRRKKNAVILKLDFHKAFGCISWNYLDWVLGEMGFPDIWRCWIRSCVMSASASVLVNGSPTEPFKLERGLRQGDPLSPFLFDIVVEPLNLLLQRAISLGLWEGVEISKDGLKLSHLQYADDTVIFAPQNIEALMNIKKTLIIFHLASGLQVKFFKSSIIGINVEESWLKMAAKTLQCRIGHLPFLYLGLPIGGCTTRLSSWESVLERMRNKLASWKGKCLSIGGRITLIKAALSSLPLYYMSLFPIPKGIVEKIVKLQRQFFWCGDEHKKFLPLAAWNLIELPKALGGLGVGNLLHRNISLLFKW